LFFICFYFDFFVFSLIFGFRERNFYLDIDNRGKIVYNNLRVILKLKKGKVMTVEYKTEQKKILIDFLKNHSEESFTIEEIEKNLINETQTPPGLSTIYRLMPKLVEEGLVKRFTGDKKRQFLYQAVVGCENKSHFHMKCTGCGKIFHMNDKLSVDLMEKILNVSNFSVDSGKTLFFGKCDVCNR